VELIMIRLLKLAMGAAAVAVVVAACSSGDSGTSAAPSSAAATSAAATSAAATTGAGTASSAAATITIQGFKFGDPITVAPGATVTVTNKDTAGHNVVSDDAGKFTTPTIQQNESSTFTAPTAPGTYKFSCTIHANMHGIGTLIVQG
jgi:plastocyanin